MLSALATPGCARANLPGPAVPSEGYCSARFQASIGWPDPDRAARVCRCESSGNPRAVSRDGRYAGLFQFSRQSWEALGGGDVFDPRLNSERALQLWRARGWTPWPRCGRQAGYFFSDGAFFSGSAFLVKSTVRSTVTGSPLNGGTIADL